MLVIFVSCCTSGLAFISGFVASRSWSSIALLVVLGVLIPGRVLGPVLIVLPILTVIGCLLWPEKKKTLFSQLFVYNFKTAVCLQTLDLRPQRLQLLPRQPPGCRPLPWRLWLRPSRARLRMECFVYFLPLQCWPVKKMFCLHLFIARLFVYNSDLT